MESKLKNTGTIEMVTFYQAKADTSHLIPIDIYSKLEMINRPIPGLLIYTDGVGNLFRLDPDGVIRNLETSAQMAYNAGYVDGHCGCINKYTGGIGVQVGDESSS